MAQKQTGVDLNDGCLMLFCSTYFGLCLIGATTSYGNLKMYLCACKSCQVFRDSFLTHISHGMGGNSHACLSE